MDVQTLAFIFMGFVIAFGLYGLTIPMGDNAQED